MAPTEAEVHVYASAREFVVVPVTMTDTGAVLEVMPVERVKLVVGRATMVALSVALRQMHLRSTGELSATRWDADNGRWWEHSLLFVVLQWQPDELVFARQELDSCGEWQTMSIERLSTSTSFSTLAEKLVHALGEQLDR